MSSSRRGALHGAPPLLLVSFSLVCSSAHAAGTPAGTDLTNQASVTYTVGSVVLTEDSNPAVVRVAEILDLSLVWQDADSVSVSPADTSRILTFLLTNTGNGQDDYALTPLTAVGGDSFDPAFVDLYLDQNGNGVYEDGTDVQYVLGSNDPTLDADSSVTIFAMNDIPAGQPDGAFGNFELTAASNTGSGPPGTVVPGAGENGTDAIVGTTGGEESDTGTYLVSNVVVAVVKSASIVDPWGTAEPVPGAVITYTLVVDVSGSGTAEGVVITDPIPANTSYAAGTLTLNTAVLTDAADLDAGDVGDTTPGTVTVALGDLAGGVSTQTIQFDVTID